MTTSPVALSLSEKDLSDNIVNLARMLGYLVHRDPTWRATGTDLGYPDLTLVRVRDHRVVWAELKSEKGRLTEAQWEWARGLANHEHYVWRPSDWYAGKVEEILR